MCDEMKKLRKWLDDNGIEWVDKSSEETLIFHYMCRTGFYYDNNWASVISGSYSYGGEDGLLEILYHKVPTDDHVKGYLTADEVIQILKG